MRIKIEDDFDNELESEYKSIDDDSIMEHYQIQTKQ